MTSVEREDAGRMRDDLLLPRVLLLPTGFRPLVARRKMEKTCKDGREHELLLLPRSVCLCWQA